MPLIRAGTLVADGQIRRPGWVQTTGREIRGCGGAQLPGPADADFPDSVVVPGFVDMHVHGGGGASFTGGNINEIGVATAFHLRHGTTTMLASLVTSAPAELIDSVSILADAIRRGQAGTVAGIHLEGPWLSPARCGAHDHTQIRVPESAEIDAALTAANGTIRMVTLAPELPGSHEAIRRFLGAETVVAVGHTDATYEQTKQAVALGATVGTHLFNAMPPLGHREPGPALALLQDPRVTVELIADGVHLHPAVVHAVTAAVGPHRVAAVTDAIAAAGSGDGPYRLGAVLIEVESGVARLPETSTIAGGTSSMDQLFRSLARGYESAGKAGEDLDTRLTNAVHMTSTTPARALGLARVGAIRTGFDANLVVLDHDLQVTAVMYNGEWVTWEN